ncbi:hypothetical protein J6590_024259 [Homalodisca vitripennis]|nr:hypothetical protein J6590_024259 [Homalodisca vitripennis]
MRPPKSLNRLHVVGRRQKPRSVKRRNFPKVRICRGIAVYEISDAPIRAFWGLEYSEEETAGDRLMIEATPSRTKMIFSH